MLQRLNQLLVPFSITLLVLAVMSLLLHHFSLATPVSALLALVLLSLLNAVVLPLAVRLTLPIALLTFGTLPLVFNALTVVLVSLIVPGFGVDDVGTAVVITFVLTLISMLIANSFLFKADRERQRYRTIERLATKGQSEQTPGLILLEIDGLAEPIFRRALKEGYMPTLAHWIRSGCYQLAAWETSLPSQTSSMQAGILHGTHENIPGFRYYDRASKRLLVSNHAADAGAMMRPLDKGDGLLREGGYSLNNWTTGDAREVLLTFTALDNMHDLVMKQSDELYSFFAQPYNVQRVLLKAGVDVIHEIWEALQQRIHNVQPRVERHFPYPLYRAATTCLFPDLSCELIVSKMFEGISTAYTTFVNYDVVAHHAGIDRPDAFRILRQVDDQIRFIAQAAQYAQRPYEFVILSDHGQSMGATFKQRYQMNLAEFINTLDESTDAVLAIAGKEEGVGHVNLLLSHLIGGGKRVSTAARKVLKKTIDPHGYVAYEPSHRQQKKDPNEAKTLVCPSGNLAHVYFTDSAKPMRLDQINAQYPKLIEGLATHEGIGFVVVRNPENVPLVLGKKGAYNLKTNEVFRENPLRDFGAHAPDHLRELMRYPNSGDIVVNSLYNTDTCEVAAFEELVGSHGGLGGAQNQPFILYPTKLNPDKLAPQVGAPALFDLFKGWQARLRQSGYQATRLPSPQPQQQPGPRPFGITVLAVMTIVQELMTLAPNVPFLMGFDILLTWQRNPLSIGILNAFAGVLHLLTIPLLILAGINLWRLKRSGLDFTIFAYAASILVGTINLLSQPLAARESLPTFIASIGFSIIILLFLLYGNSVRRAFPQYERQAANS